MRTDFVTGDYRVNERIRLTEFSLLLASLGIDPAEFAFISHEAQGGYHTDVEAIRTLTARVFKTRRPGGRRLSALFQEPFSGYLLCRASGGIGSSSRRDGEQISGILERVRHDHLPFLDFVSRSQTSAVVLYRTIRKRNYSIGNALVASCRQSPGKIGIFSCCCDSSRRFSAGDVYSTSECCRRS